MGGGERMARTLGQQLGTEELENGRCFLHFRMRGSRWAEGREVVQAGDA